MGLIVLPEARRQPQGGVQIDWSNPLTRDLLFSVALSGGSGLASIGTDKRVGTVVTAASIGATRQGTATKLDGTGYLDFGSTAILPSRTTPFTLTLYEKNLSPGAYATLIGLVSGANEWVWLRGTAAGYYCALGLAIGGVVNNYSSVGAAVAGEEIRFVVRGNAGTASATDYDVWANGVKLTSVSSNFAGVSANTNRIGWDGVDDKFNGLIQDVNLFGRAWADSEIAEYFGNPYQIYRPQSRSIWVPAAAYVAPPVGTLGQFDPEMRLAAWF